MTERATKGPAGAVLTGSCLCGDIAFAIKGPISQMAHCHCSMCRKLHGGAFATFGMASAEHFEWTRGGHRVAGYESSPGAQRTFCPRCGASLPAPEDRARVVVPMGNVAEDPGTRPHMHVFAASKAPWHEIMDDLPQHAAFPPGFTGPAPIEAAPRKAQTPGTTGGSCLCGEVSFEYHGAPEAMLNCHCSRCRRAMSAAWATMMAVRPSAFRWLSGEAQVVNYKMPEARFKGTAFCRRCSAQLPRRRDADHMQIPAGCLDDDPGITPSANIFTASRAAWAVMDERLPCFAERHGA